MHVNPNRWFNCRRFGFILESFCASCICKKKKIVITVLSLQSWLASNNKQEVCGPDLTSKTNFNSRQWWRQQRLLPDYIVQHCRRQSSSYSPLWEHKISRKIIFWQCLCFHVINDHFFFTKFITNSFLPHPQTELQIPSTMTNADLSLLHNTESIYLFFPKPSPARSHLN